MRILIHMGDTYPNEGPNAKRMRTFYEAFREKGHEVYVLAPTYENEPVQYPDVYYCKTPPLTDKSSFNRLLNQIGFGVGSFFKSFHIGKIDVVITTTPPALISPFGWLIAKFKHAKLVYDVRDIWPDVAWEMGSFDRRSMYSRIFEFVRNFMLKHSDMITAVSDGKVEKLRGYVPKARVVNITNGLDEKFLENPDKDELVEKYHLTRFTCVYVGNLGLAQGLMQLMYVAGKAKEKSYDVQFLLFGSGVEEKLLKDYAKEHSLDNVFFPGRLPNIDMYTILKHSQMSFVSLVNDKLKDSVPTKMFEALGVGCPVLLAAAGDSANILNECGLGIAVKPNDKDGLWEAFSTMYRNMPEILKHREDAQRIICTKYSRQHAAEKMECELRKMIQYSRRRK